MQKLVLLSLLLSSIYSQQCNIKIQSLNVYPTDTEYFDLNLETLFEGYNLTFTVMGGPPSVSTVNYIQPMDLGGTLPDGFEYEAAAIRLHQVTELWDEQIAILGNVDNLPTVFFSHLSYNGSPTFSSSGKTLLQSQYAYHPLPNSLTWIDSEYVIIDTWFVTQSGGLMFNAWQRIDNFEGSLPAIFQSSNNQNHMGGTTSRQTQFYRGPKYNYLFRGTFSNNIDYPNFLEVFRLVDNVPDEQPCGQITTSQIPGMQMVDYEVSNVGEVWILNWSSTLLRFTMSFDDAGVITFKQTATYPLPAMSNYLSIDLEVDYKTPVDKTFSILIANTNPIGNILEYTLLPNSEPIFVGFYSVPVALKYTGVPPNIDSNIKFISVQYLDYTNPGNSQVYLLERPVPTLNVMNYLPFHVDQITYSRHSYWHSLNEQPSMILTLDTQMFLSVVEYPQLYGQFLTTQTGTMTVTAISNQGNNPNPNSCHVDVHYVYLPKNDTSIQYANPTVKWPSDAFFPKNHSLDFSKYLNGPSINISGIVTINQLNNLQTGLQNLPQVSSIIQTTVLPLQMTAPSHYPQTGIFVKNAYNDDDKTFLQFVQDNKEIQAFICYQGEYDAQKTCHFVDQSDTRDFTIEKLEVLWPLNGIPYVYCFSRMDDDNHNTLVMWALEWDHSKLTGYFKFVSSVSVTIDTPDGVIPIVITDFTVVDQQLYVTLNQINQIWEYEVVTNGANTYLNKSLVISNDILKLSEGFSPVGCVGNTKQFGPVLIINNQYEFVIISTLNNNLRFVSNTQFPLTTPGLSSQISISGEYLIVCQASLSQSSIAAYSLYDLTQPVFEKELPLYGAKLYTPIQVTSDSYFFFAVLEDVSVNVYRPSVASHETLFHQFKNQDPSIYFHFSSVYDGDYAYLSFVNSTVVLNKRIQKHLTCVFQPGSYDNSYFVKQNFQLTATNIFNATPLVASHDIEVFNSQISVNFDEQKFNASTKGKLQATASKQNLSLSTLTQNFLTGAVAEYQVKCSICPDIIKVINKVSAYQSDIKFEGAKIYNVNSMVNAPSAWFDKKNKNTASKYGTIVATITSLYLVNDKLDVTYIQSSHSNSKSIADCQGLAASDQFIVTACELKSGGTDFQVLPVSSSDPVYFSQGQLINPTYVQIIGQNLLVLGTDQSVSADPVVLIYNFDLDTKNIQRVGAFKCSDKYDDGVNDFEIAGPYSFSNAGVNYQTYVLFYTCMQAKESPYYATIQLNTANNQLTLGTQGALIDTTKLQLLVDTFFFQIQPLKFSASNPKQTQIGLFMSTSNVMNFIFNFVFDLTASSQSLTAPLVSYTQVSTIPPYGDWTAVNALTFQNQILVLPYNSQETLESFIAVYDISAVDFTKQNQPPTLMSGGFYAPSANEFYYQLQQYTQGNPVLLLTSSSNDIFNLSSIIIQKEAYLSINSTSGFENQKLLVTAGNYFDKRTLNYDLSYNPPQPSQSKGLAWWGWLLIVLSIILVIAGGAAGWVYFKNKQSNVLPLLEQS